MWFCGIDWLHDCFPPLTTSAFGNDRDHFQMAVNMHIYDAASEALEAYKRSLIHLNHHMSRLDGIREHLLITVCDIFKQVPSECFIDKVMDYVYARRFTTADDTPYFAAAFEYVAQELYSRRQNFVNVPVTASMVRKCGFPMNAVPENNNPATTVASGTMNNNTDAPQLFLSGSNLRNSTNSSALNASAQCSFSKSAPRVNPNPFVRHKIDSTISVVSPKPTKAESLSSCNGNPFSKSMPTVVKRSANNTDNDFKAKKMRNFDSESETTASPSSTSSSDDSKHSKDLSLDTYLNYAPEMRGFIEYLSKNTEETAPKSAEIKQKKLLATVDSVFRQSRPKCTGPKQWQWEAKEYIDKARSAYADVFRRMSTALPLEKRFCNLLISDMALKSRRKLLKNCGHLQIDYPYHWSHLIECMEYIPTTNCTLKSFVVCVGFEFCARFKELSYVIDEINNFYETFFAFYDKKYYKKEASNTADNTQTAVYATVPPKIIMLTVPLIRTSDYPCDFIRQLNRCIRKIAKEKQALKYPVNLYDWDHKTRDIDQFTPENFSDRFKRLFVALDGHCFFDESKKTLSKHQ